MTNPSSLVWTEKHRPNKLADVKGNDFAVKKLQEWVGKQEVPHVLLDGAPGCGKTSLVLAFAKETYGDTWQQNVLSLNASDERGIDTVRTKVKKFAQRSPPLNSNVDFNLILLDEADSLTSDAQSALRRILEEYSDNAKFFFTCNYKSQIISALQSRCLVLNMNPITMDQVEESLTEISNQEGVEYNEEAIHEIARRSEGDLRSAIGTLQGSVVDNELTVENVKEMSSDSKRHELEAIINLCAKGEIGTGLEKFDKDFLKAGVDPQHIFAQTEEIVLESDMENERKAKMLEVIADGNWRVFKGASPAIHLHNMLLQLSAARFTRLEDA